MLPQFFRQRGYYSAGAGKRSDTPGYAFGGNKFDLNQWDPAHFARLRDFVAEAGKRGIVVDLVLFTPLFSEHHWSLSPFNPVNNVSGIDPRVTRTDVLTLDRHGGLLRIQEALVRKIVTELRSFDNVIYELNHRRDLDNMTMEWERHMFDVLDQAQKAVGDRKLMALNLGGNTRADQEVDARLGGQPSQCFARGSSVLMNSVSRRRCRRWMGPAPDSAVAGAFALRPHAPGARASRATVPRRRRHVETRNTGVLGGHCRSRASRRGCGDATMSASRMIVRGRTLARIFPAAA
ncbi:MAG: hypothetical protein ACREF9_06465 [Opitutaceae bacterium]